MNSITMMEYDREKYRGLALASKDPAERAEYWELVIINDIIGKYSEAYYNAGLAYFDSGVFNLAAERLDTAIEIKPDDCRAWDTRGRVRTAQGDFKGAVVDHTIAVSINVNFCEAYYNRAIAKSGLGDDSAALQDYNDALRIKENFFEALTNRSVERAKIGDISGALTDINQAISLQPNNAIPYAVRGMIHFNSKRFQLAIEDFELSLPLFQIYEGSDKEPLSYEKVNGFLDLAKRKVEALQ